MAATTLERIRAHSEFIGHVTLSAVFFSIFAVVIWFFHPQDLPYFGTNILTAVFFSLGMVSFLGGALFLYTTADDGRAWDFRLPLVGLAAVVTISTFLFPAFQTPAVLAVLPSLGVMVAMVGSYALVLLAPAAILFFHSLRPIRRNVIDIHIVLSLAVSLLSGFLFLGLLLQAGGPFFPYPDESVYGLGFWLYLVFGMPIVGIFILGTALNWKPVHGG